MTAILAAAAGARFISVAATVQLSNQTITKISKTTSTATYQITSDGTVRNQASTVLEAWLTGGSASNYEVRATVTTGSINSGTTGSWLSCSSNRAWSITNSDPDTNASAVLLIEIRDSATQTVRASASITLIAVVNSGFGGGGGTQ
jgi:hypothetical protein